MHEFKLPLGYLNKKNDLIKNVEVTGMTAKTRKMISSPQYKSNSGKLMTFMLKQCVTKLGKDEPSMTQLRSLTTGDRDFLIYMIRKVSLGDDINVRYKCIFCEDVQDVTLYIDSIPILESDGSEFEIENQRFIATLINEQLKIELKTKLPTGIEQEHIANIKDPIEANYKMYELCLTEWNGEVGPFGTAFVDDMPVAADDWLTMEMRDIQPGIQTSHKISCGNCYGENTVTMENSDFLSKIRA